MIRTQNSTFWIDKDDILYCQFQNKDSNFKFNVDKVTIFIEAISKLCNGKAMPFLIDTRDSKGTFSSAAANLFAHSPTLVNLRISEAFVVNTVGIKLLITSYKRIYEPHTPFKIFSDMVLAREYCLDTKMRFYNGI